jgi:uncharacterized membrane protein
VPTRNLRLMRERELWWAIALAIAGLGIAAVVQIFSADDIGFELPASLLTSLGCGAVALGGLALLGRRKPLPWLGIGFLLWAVASYVLLQISVWDSGFGERHERLLATVAVLVLAAALLATLGAQVREAAQPLRLMTAATATVITVAAGYGIALILANEAPSKSEGRALELFTTLALVGYFATPVVQRALRRSQRPPAETATPSPAA